MQKRFDQKEPYTGPVAFTPEQRQAWKRDQIAKLQALRKQAVIDPPSRG